jgi:hypothetical protein
MKRPSVRVLRAFAFALLPFLCGCRAAENLIYKPKPDDPQDGYQGSLAVAGVNTEMDWGPHQSLLLSEFKTLKEEQARTQKRLDQVLAENQNLNAQLSTGSESLNREQSLRRQAEAETKALQQKLLEREAKILSLSIEKAKLEQMNLLAKISEMQASLKAAAPATEAAMPPTGRR